MQRSSFLFAAQVLILSGHAAAQGMPTPPFKFDRTSEDWSMMKDEANQTRPWHDLKWIEFGDAGHITLGGEFKLREEWIDAPNFGATGLGEDAYRLQRTLLHADVTFNKNVRTFIQLSQHEASGRDVFFPLDDGGVDLHQGFLEFGFQAGKTDLDFRAGRQELALSPRLGATREGANVRANYDGVRLIAVRGDVRAEAWWLQPVIIGQDSFDDEADAAQDFSGARATYSFGEKKAWRATGSLYHSQRDLLRVGAAAGPDERSTWGVRLQGTEGAFDLDFEHFLQTGDFAAQDVRAFFGGGDAGYTLKDLPWAPRIGARWLYGSGDESAQDNESNTFVGVVARPVCCSDPFWIAPANTRTYAPVFTVTPSKTLSVEIKYDFVDRLEAADAIYSVPLQAYPRTAGRGDTGRISAGPSILAAWSPVPEVTLLVSHTEQSAEGVLKAVGGKDGDFSWASLTLRF